MGNLFSRKKKKEQRGSVSAVSGGRPTPQPATPPTTRPLPPIPGSSGYSSNPASNVNSRSNTPPTSSPHSPATTATAASSASAAPLPTIPTLVSPLNGRAISAESNDGSSDEMSPRPGGEDAPIALDIRVDSGGDAAESFWDRLSSREDLKRTFRPVNSPGARNGRLQQTIKATMRATLGGGDIMETVKLPPGEDANEWIAVNTIHFFNAASLIWATCSQFCTPESCPLMTAGRAEYLWKVRALAFATSTSCPTPSSPPLSRALVHLLCRYCCRVCCDVRVKDDAQYKKPTRLSAPEYIELLLTWVDAAISDTSIFPVEEGARFPRNFLSEVRNIYKRLFRLYAHLYCHHAEKIKSIGANAHLNTCFKHFSQPHCTASVPPQTGAAVADHCLPRCVLSAVYFVLEFNLMDKMDLAPLQKLIDRMRENDRGRDGGAMGGPSTNNNFLKVGR